MIIEKRPKDDQPSDYYFFLWNVTEEGLRNLHALKETIARASAMVRKLGGKCRGYVTIGGPYDIVGIAQGIDDAKAAKLLLAVNALRTIHTTAFFKATDFYLPEYGNFITDATKLARVKS